MLATASSASNSTRLTAAVAISLVIAGDVSSFDAGALRTNLATLCGVPSTNIFLSITAASVRVNATILTANASEAVAVEGRLDAVISMGITATSQALNCTIEEVCAPFLLVVDSLELQLATDAATANLEVAAIENGGTAETKAILAIVVAVVAVLAVGTVWQAVRRVRRKRAQTADAFRTLDEYGDTGVTSAGPPGSKPYAPTLSKDSSHAMDKDETCGCGGHARGDSREGSMVGEAPHRHELIVHGDDKGPDKGAAMLMTRI